MSIVQYAFLVSWLIQGAVSVAFMIALAGLAISLRRPGAAILAWKWVLLVGVCAAAVVQGLTRPDDGMLIFGFISYLVSALVFATIPFVEAAAAAVASSGRHVPRYRTRAAIAFAVAFAAAFLLTEGMGRLTGPESLTRLIVPRLVVAAAFGWGAVLILQVRARADARYRLALGVYALGAALQVPRSFLSVLFDDWARSGGAPDLAASLYILQNVVAMVILGVTSFLLALTEERFATFDQGRQLQQTALRLERAQRLESLGRLAGGVAHDFTNVLAAIAGSGQLARLHLRDPAHVSAELDAIREASERGTALTQQLKDYARMAPREPERFDAGDRLRKSEGFLRRLVEPAVTLRIEAGEDPVAVRMDPSQFDQVVMNLVLNARDAMTQGGPVTVRLETMRLDAPRSRSDVELPAGDYAELTVHDRGVGVPPAIARTIFEPFFTTRGAKGGTGLGLATVLSAVRAAKGDVAVTSSPGKGTEFEVLLPLES